MEDVEEFIIFLVVLVISGSLSYLVLEMLACF